MVEREELEKEIAEAHAEADWLEIEAENAQAGADRWRDRALTLEMELANL